MTHNDRKSILMTLVASEGLLGSQLAQSGARTLLLALLDFVASPEKSGRWRRQRASDTPWGGTMTHNDRSPS